MRVPLPWLAEYVALKPGVDAAQVAADLVRVGLEEEALHGGDVSGPVVVGRVLELVREPQKNGRTIAWCQVDVGSRQHGIVCGAPNVQRGDLVVVALPGAELPGGFAISARTTYGHVSDGMICSARELGLGEDHSGIIRLVELGLGEAAPGADATALLGLAEQVVEVNVTPDRGYALSVRGIAREYGLATGAPFRDPALVEVPAATPDGFAVHLDDAAPVRGTPGCDRFVARVVRGIDPTAPSPRWLRRRLEQAGMRSISLTVDITNYVMLAVGQPLHAYDLSSLEGPITVRRAGPGERLTTLDGADRALHPEDLLITDAAGVLGLAGVMGGARGEVGPGTTDVLVEAAHFDPVTVARSMRRHKLSTEAGRRFERGVDDGLAAAAAQLAVRLLLEHCGGAVTVGPVTDVDRRRTAPALSMPVDLPTRVVGAAYSRDDVVDTLTAIGCTVTGQDPLLVTPPSWRPDLRLGVDLVEEVARLRGYAAIPSVLPIAPPGRGLTGGQRVRRSVARAMADHGLVEVLSYPFVPATVSDALGLPADDPRRSALRLANPLSQEQPFLRTNLLGTLLETLRRNLGRGAGDMGLFEIGLVTRPSGPARAPRPAGDGSATAVDLDAVRAAVPHQPRRLALVLTGWRTLPGWSGPGRPADWTDALESALLVARTVGLEPSVRPDTDHMPWHPGRCARLEIGGTVFGHAGELHPAVLGAFDLPPRTVAAEVDLDVLSAAYGEVVQAAPLSTFPPAKEDVALVADAAVPAARIEAALVAGAGELLESIRLFDVYTGPQVGAGRRSLAFALRFRAADRTLTAQETAAARTAAVAEATARTGAVLRS